MKRSTLVGLSVLAALALALPPPVLAGCRGGRCSARAAGGPGPLVKVVGGVGRVVGKVLPPWRK